MTTESHSFSTLHQALGALLKQGQGLLESLSDAQYVEACPEANSTGIGGHYRHTLEHISPLLTSLTNDLLDYDAREREVRLETDREYAKAVTQDLLLQAQQCHPQDFDKKIRVRCSVSQDSSSPVVESTLAREIMYAEIHAIHHFAIIKIICSLKGVSLPNTFGVAPSTLNHRETVSA